MKKIFKLLITVLISVLGICACENEADLVFKLALDNEKLNLSKEASSTQVMVYCNSSWQASFTENVDWAVIENGKGKGDGYFVIKWENNQSVARLAEITVKSGNETKTLAIAQEGSLSTIVLDIVSEPQTHIALGGSYSVDLEQNLGELYKDLETEVIYKDVAGYSITPAEPWISDIVVSADKISYNVAPNKDGADRYAVLKVSIEFPEIKQMNGTTETIIFEGGVYSAEVAISQSLEAGVMAFKDESIDISSHGGEINIAWEADLGSFFNQVVTSIDYEGTETGWISNVNITNETVTFEAQPNQGKSNRSATITFSFEYSGFELTASLQVNQVKQEKEVSMADLRAMLTSAGSIELDGDYINALVIVDGGNLNAETNTQISYDLIDFETTLVTNYIESLDGQYGMRIRTLTKEDNQVLRSGTSVKISLGGLTLTREDNPTRYTLSGLVSTAVGGAQASTLPSKIKAINQLTDDDIYTFVTIKDVEIALPFGSFNNTPKQSEFNGDTGDSRCDYAARFLRNAEGDMISMLVNGKTPWRFIDEDVPAGSGNVSAVVVYDDLLRAPDHKGIGSPYQLRPLNLSDIALDKTNSFSNTLTYWYFPAGKTSWTAEAGYVSGKKYRVRSVDQKGWIDCSKTGSMNQSDGFIAVNEIDWTASTTKCLRYGDLATFWDSTLNKADSYFDISFPTTDIAAGKHITLIFSAVTAKNLATVSVTPVNYVFSYSVDGVNFTELGQRRIYPWSHYDFTQTSLPGAPTELVIPLPDAAAGQEQVIVRFMAADDACVNKDTGLFDGKYTATATYIRFPAITVKYNK